MLTKENLTVPYTFLCGSHIKCQKWTSCQ